VAAAAVATVTPNIVVAAGLQGSGKALQLLLERVKLRLRRPRAGVAARLGCHQAVHRGAGEPQGIEQLQLGLVL
jgi:hypothetical protein